MKKNQWMLGILSILFCVIAVFAYPTQTKAANQSAQNAYRAIFDASYYYNSYSDVAAACGTDENALFEHYMNFGIYEGRSSSASFNPQAYRQRYTDLQEAFGNDMAAYCQHYVFHGRSEGRDAGANGQAATPVSGSASTSRVSVCKNTKTAEKSEEKQEVTSETTLTATEESKNDKKETATEESKNDKKEIVTQAVKSDKKLTTTEETKSDKKETAAKSSESTKKETAAKSSESTEKKAEKSIETVMNIKSTEEILATELSEASISETDVKMVKSAATEMESAEQKSRVIGSYTTEYEPNISRAVNVELAAERIHGIKLQPGEKFSFSNTILERTAENGYVNGPVFVKGKEVQGIGGGVCQVSSTLYAAMVDAGLKATERHPHSMPVDYVPQNLDATIAGDYLDLKFTNTFSQTLLIDAYAENGILTVTLLLE